MDYLDPRTHLRHTIMLFIGYALIGVAIIIATIILLYQAYGFGVNRSGSVIQNGLLFFSSQPRSADIYINGTLAKSKTNTRLVLPSGIYRIKLDKTGYRPWERTVELDGGSVAHYDYPLLFPKNMITTKLQSYTAAPGVATQSPDQRWVVVAQADSMTNFDVYDLKNPANAPVVITLPANLLSKATTGESWVPSEWADDNQHLVLKHLYNGKTEFIELNRTAVDQSVNLNVALAASPTKLTLNDKKYDQFYLYNADATLQTASLNAPTAVLLLSQVLAYQSYGSDAVLYVTGDGASNGKVAVKYTQAGQSFTIRTLPAGTNYLLNLTKYSGVFYFAVGAASENKVYVYKDPIGQINSRVVHSPVPIQVLHVENPNYIGFSSNAQFIMAENGQQFGVYDIENKRGYNYITTQPLDTPQAHAAWMDGNRLSYVSGGKLLIFDYDDTNMQSLVTAASAYLPFFAPDYQHLYFIAPEAVAGQFNLSQASLLIP
ncbi:MAG: PEGA domain-containing protein [Candidatus Saccharibacteria bacterium]